MPASPPLLSAACTAGASSFLPVQLLHPSSVLPLFWKHPVLFISKQGHLSAPLFAQSTSSLAQKWLQQWMLLLLAVCTALSLIPVLSQGETFHSGVDVSCPVQTQLVSGSPAAWRHPGILGRDEAVPHSISGDHQLGEVGFSQSFSPIQQQLQCIGVPAWLCLSSSWL